MRIAAVARAGPCRGRFTHFVPLPPTRAATGWCIGGPCRLPSRSAETTIRPFRPPLRPPAPTAFSLRLASPVPNHRLGATGGVPCASIIWLARALHALSEAGGSFLRFLGQVIRTTMAAVLHPPYEGLLLIGVMMIATTNGLTLSRSA